MSRELSAAPSPDPSLLTLLLFDLQTFQPLNLQTRFGSISFVSNHFRTLLRNGAISSPLLSITCALFPMQWGGVPLFGLATRHFSRNSFICHTSEKSSAKSFRMRSYKNAPRNPFRMRSSEKKWREGHARA